MARLIVILSFLTLPVLMLSCGGGNSRGADITYVALGASDAIGIGATPLTNGYVYRIRDELENRGQETHLRNLGIPGARIHLIRETELRAAVLEDFDLVTIFVGANDIVDGGDVESFENNLARILDALREKSATALIVIATLPDMTRLPRFVDRQDRDVTVERLEAYNAAILRQASSHGAQVADLRVFSIEADVTSQDGFHPSDRGHELIAQAFLGEIIPALAPDTAASR